MKLYTEEQVRKAIALAQDCDSDCGGVYFLYETPDGIIEELTPIELPSDEEIEEYVDSTPYCGHCTFEFKEGVEYGAKWVIEQIKQQDKW